jgi:hypothetical protein
MSAREMGSLRRQRLRQGTLYLWAAGWWVREMETSFPLTLSLLKWEHGSHILIPPSKACGFKTKLRQSYIYASKTSLQSSFSKL